MARAATTLIALLVVLALPAQALAHGWTRPIRLAAPAALDPLGPIAAVAPNGQAAVAFGLDEAATPSAGRASVVLISGQDRAAPPVHLPADHQVLDLGFLGGVLQLLTGVSATREPCCTSLQIMALGAQGLAAPHTLLRKLSGGGLGRLVPVARGTLAAYANPSGVWVMQAKTGERFGPPHQLSSSAAGPTALAAVGAGAHTLVAWTTGGDQAADRTSPSVVLTAAGSSTRVPHGSEGRVTLASGHSSSELQLIHGSGGSTAAWVEDYFDSTGTYQSEVVATGLSGAPRPRIFTAPGLSVGGLAAASDAAGDEMLTWKACDAQPVCSVKAVSRGAGGRFATPVTLGPIDPAADPAVALTRNGAAVVGWVNRGRVTVAVRTSAGRAFAGPTRLAGSADAAGLTLAAGTDGRIVAAWSENAAKTTFRAAEWR